jgi:hypothetical protein
MTLQFTNVVKGHVTQTLLTTLLERGGYRVTRLGIEELFGEIKYLEMQQYLALNLPLQLRYLPDLLVAELDMTNVFLVEVKFRRGFDSQSVKSLHDELRKQREYWPQSYAVIMIADPVIPGRGHYHQDHIRVLKPNETDMLTDESRPLAARWENLHYLQRVFMAFNNERYAVDIQDCADSLTQTLQDLAKL